MMMMMMTTKVVTMTTVTMMIRTAKGVKKVLEFFFIRTINLTQDF